MSGTPVSDHNASNNAAALPLTIKFGHVYIGANGDVRLVKSVGYAPTAKQNAVVEWRTIDPKLPAGQKAQGSATLASFRRWAAKLLRKATKEDWDAFGVLQRRRASRASWEAAWRKKKRHLALHANIELRCSG